MIGAGAGIGVDSGLPDFRGNEGFWKAYPALGRARMNFEAAASPATFMRDPRLAWGFYGHRLQLYRDTVPHEGFAMLRAWSDCKPYGGYAFTSNVDAQFQRAGFEPSRVQECHGSIHHLQCMRCCSDSLWPAAERLPDHLPGFIDTDACRWIGDLPICPKCAGLLRPNILMFNDYAWIPRRAAVQRANLDVWLSRVERPVVIEIGAGLQVPSVRSFTAFVQRTLGAKLVRINPRDGSVSRLDDVSLPVGALRGLRLIDSALRLGAA